MRKVVLFMMSVIASVMLMTSCNSCVNKPVNPGAVTEFVEWSASVQAEGDGTLVFKYPSGQIELVGAAKFSATSDSDLLPKDSTLFLGGALNAENVLETPGEYSPEQVAFVQQVNEDYVKATEFIAEGTWSVDIKLYAKQPQTGLYVVFTKHFPEEKQAEE